VRLGAVRETNLQLELVVGTFLGAKEIPERRKPTQYWLDPRIGPGKAKTIDIEL
jgi:hypothetical protein